MSNIFSTAFAEKKKIKRILILGPYKPPPAKERLIRLRACLLAHGYENAKIVEDFPNIPKYDEDPDKHFTLKSQDGIRNWADVLVFVFMCEANNLGVWSELQFTLDFVKDKIRYSIELHEQGVDLSSQTRGPLKIARMNSSEFCSDRKLCDLAMAFCTNVVYEFLW